MNSTHFRPKAVTLTWCREIIGYFLPYWRNYHLFGAIPPFLVNSSIIGEIWWISRFPRFLRFGAGTVISRPQKLMLEIRGEGGLFSLPSPPQTPPLPVTRKRPIQTSVCMVRKYTTHIIHVWARKHSSGTSSCPTVKHTLGGNALLATPWNTPERRIFFLAKP